MMMPLCLHLIVYIIHLVIDSMPPRITRYIRLTLIKLPIDQFSSC